MRGDGRRSESLKVVYCTRSTSIQTLHVPFATYCHLFCFSSSPSPFLFIGDVIIDASVIDEGWMEGRVESTGQYGMLPSNYVQKM